MNCFTKLYAIMNKSTDKETVNDSQAPSVPSHNTYGGMVTGAELDRLVSTGDIVIEPYNKDNLNPNSYNLTIGNTIIIVDDSCVIDLRRQNGKTNIVHEITEDGFLLVPNTLYLIATQERINTSKYIPIITGRSSIGRLGITVHQEAGFGDIGFSGNWTLQVKVTYPTIIYPNITMCQVYFLTPHGSTEMQYDGKYQNSKGAIPSKYDKDFDTKE